MSAVVEIALGEELIAHLDRRLESVARMQAIVLTQGAAIRRRDVRAVVASAGELQVEMHRRELLEAERIGLMQRAARQLGLRPDQVGFTSVQRLLDAESSQVAAQQTAELTRLLQVTDREHQLNRRLLAQELAFLDHLLSLADGTGGYAARPEGCGALASGAATPRIRRNVNPARRRVFDLEA